MAKKAKLGTGKRFAALEKSIEQHKTGKTELGKKMAEAKPGGGKIKDPAALAAVIGREKYGAKKMAAMAGKGRHKAAEKRKAAKKGK